VSRIASTPTGPGRLASALRGFLTGIGGLAYAFVVWTAVFYAIQLSAGGMTGYGWFLLLLPAAVAAVIFAVALVLCRRRTIGVFILVLLAGLGLSAVFLLNTFSYVIRNLEALTGG
jgi:hypothetical protein